MAVLLGVFYWAVPTNCPEDKPMSDELQQQIDQLRAELDSKQAKIADLSKENAKWRRQAQGKDSVEIEEHTKVLDELESLKAANANLSKTSKDEMEKLTNALKEKDGALQQHLIDGGLSDALAKAKVKPELMDAAKALLRGQAAIKAEGGNYQAIMGEKPLFDAVTEWASGDQGKHFVLADANSGGGATGGNSGGTGKSFKNMTSEERVALFRTDPARYEQLKQSAN